MDRLVLALCCAVSLSAAAADQKLAAADVPASVRSAVEARYPSAKALDWSREVENGRTEYEAKLSSGVEVTVSSEGQILSEESAVAFEELPAPVRQAFAASRYGRWKVRKAEKIVAGAKTSYEVAAAHRTEGVEVVFDAQGAIEKEEKLLVRPRER